MCWTYSVVLFYFYFICTVVCYFTLIFLFFVFPYYSISAFNVLLLIWVVIFQEHFITSFGVFTTQIKYQNVAGDFLCVVHIKKNKTKTSQIESPTFAFVFSSAANLNQFHVIEKTRSISTQKNKLRITQMPCIGHVWHECESISYPNLTCPPMSHFYYDHSRPVWFLFDKVFHGSKRVFPRFSSDDKSPLAFRQWPPRWTPVFNTAKSKRNYSCWANGKPWE